MNFAGRLARHGGEIQSALDTFLEEIPPSVIRDGMSHALSGGKRLRGFLVLESAALHELETRIALPAACAIEAMHAYSLVHDDLPSMDDDALRRGRPTVHVKWDEATAILVGDALQSLAFSCLDALAIAPEHKVALIGDLAWKSGAGGMVLGQAQDIAAETAGTVLTLDEIIALQRNKTGALIEWSAAAGARMIGASPGPLVSYARALGLAFQIADDILDVEGSEAATGKRLGKDAKAGKATFVSLLGLDVAKARARDLVEEAQDALEPYGDAANSLREAARFVISRDR